MPVLACAMSLVYRPGKVCSKLLHLSGSMFCLHRKLKSNSVTIHKNLIVAIFIAELTFLVGINRTEDQVNSPLKQLYSRFRSIIFFFTDVLPSDKPLV